MLRPILVSNYCVAVNYNYYSLISVDLDIYVFKMVHFNEFGFIDND